MASRLILSDGRGGEDGVEGGLVAGQGDAHVVAEPELLLGLPEQLLELGRGQAHDRHDVYRLRPAPTYTAKCPLGTSPAGRPDLIPPPQARRASPQHLLQVRRLPQLIGPHDRHDQSGGIE